MNSTLKTISIAFICIFCFNGCLLSSSREAKFESRGYPHELKTNDRIPDDIKSKVSLINRYGKPDVSYIEAGSEFIEYKRTINFDSSGTFGCVLVSYARAKTVSETTRFMITNDVVVSVTVDSVEK